MRPDHTCFLSYPLLSSRFSLRFLRAFVSVRIAMSTSTVFFCLALTCLMLITQFSTALPVFSDSDELSLSEKEAIAEYAAKILNVVSGKQQVVFNSVKRNAELVNGLLGMNLHNLARAGK